MSQILVVKNKDNYAAKWRANVSVTPAAEAANEEYSTIAALKRCATQNLLEEAPMLRHPKVI